MDLGVIKYISCQLPNSKSCPCLLPQIILRRRTEAALVVFQLATMRTTPRVRPEGNDWGCKARQGTGPVQ